MVYVFLFLLSVLISSFSQILLKISANKEHQTKKDEYLNSNVFYAYMLFLISSLLTVIAYRGVPLSIGPVFEATGYIWVSLLSMFILHEKISTKKWIGLGFIIIGIVVFSL